MHLGGASRKLLRFTTAGSVDDGKSTLIGRLLYDSQGIYEDQLASVRASRINRSPGAIDFSLLTDGLRAEREQGITIDVAYRYFSTPRRKFIIADTPGHEQYTRNMATGASTADVAVILIDATKGLLPQSRRHAYIASLLGIRHIVAAINKMDLVGYSQSVFENIAQHFNEYAETFEFETIYPLPVSAVGGDNVVRRSQRTAWFDGPALLTYLEELPLEEDDASDGAVRFPVQYVVRPDARFRGFAGELASGTLHPGDAVIALPSGRKTRIKSIITYDGELDEARPGEAITVTLEDELDTSRGDLLTGEEKPPSVSRTFSASLVWMHEKPLEPGAYYLLKHTTRTVRARVKRLLSRVDIHTFAEFPAETLHMNDIAKVEIEATLPLFFDPYRRIRTLGSLILIDPVSNATVAAGMIDGTLEKSIHQPLSSAAITPAERQQIFGHRAAAVWITGPAGIAESVERSLLEQGWRAHLLGSEFSEGEWRGAARALRDAGMVAIFSGAGEKNHRRDHASQLFSDNFFAFDEQEESVTDAAARIVSTLRKWREG
ncbi:MAG: sulfate adenylyltransferase subunit CysN [Candidatus Angelobacter sp. Gp1-AA117]|nr:MAG: sulfate adenylyltransferase subunit CysN [Candidatus Angelobacter sp. Gp1-AA117]